MNPVTYPPHRLTAGPDGSLVAVVGSAEDEPLLAQIRRLGLSTVELPGALLGMTPADHARLIEGAHRR